MVSHLISSHHISFHLITSLLIASHLISSHHIASHHILSHLITHHTSHEVPPSSLAKRVGRLPLSSSSKQVVSSSTKSSSSRTLSPITNSDFPSSLKKPKEISLREETIIGERLDLMRRDLESAKTSLLNSFHSASHRDTPPQELSSAHSEDVQFISMLSSVEIDPIDVKNKTNAIQKDDISIQKVKHVKEMKAKEMTTKEMTTKETITKETIPEETTPRSIEKDEENMTDKKSINNKFVETKNRSNESSFLKRVFSSEQTRLNMQKTQPRSSHSTTTTPSAPPVPPPIDKATEQRWLEEADRERQTKKYMNPITELSTLTVLREAEFMGLSEETKWKYVQTIRSISPKKNKKMGSPVSPKDDNEMEFDDYNVNTIGKDKNLPLWYRFPVLTEASPMEDGKRKRRSRFLSTVSPRLQKSFAYGNTSKFSAYRNNTYGFVAKPISPALKRYGMNYWRDKLGYILSPPNGPKG